MDRVIRAHALLLGLLVLFTVADLLAGRDQGLIGLLAVPSLLAASLVGRWATAAYGVLSLITAAALGVYDGQYTAAAISAQTVRLIAITAAGVLAVGVCALRVRRETQLARLSAEAAAAEAALRLGETLQRHLLGPPPVVPAFPSAARYRPALRGTRVGGDWYDAFPTVDGGTVLVIGDVVGHDPEAAAAMAEIRGMLRAVAVEAASPAGVLHALDRVMAHPATPALVTVVVATITRTRDGATLCWSNAGHPPPALVSGDGSVRLLERTPESLLGVTPDTPRTDAEVTLQPGDTLLLYTDGLVERRDGTLDEGSAWLVEELHRHAGEPLDELCDRLLAAAAAARDDDVALFAVRVPE